MLGPYGKANKSFPDSIKVSHGKNEGFLINDTINGRNHSDCMTG